jgi:transcription-repair coupling factor (superfamily II helicase)
MGRRMHALLCLACERPAPCLVITTVDATLQRVPPPSALVGVRYRLVPGAALDLDDLRVQLQRAGYVLEERVDEPGELAIRGEVIDIFPAGADYPVRIASRRRN